jgi:alpha-beta hydrolase superfamily lysophospholipase
MINSISGATKKTKNKTFGGSLERFQDCRFDIQAAVNFLKKKGCNKIYLVGHSTGTQKAAYYITKKPDSKVKGVILLAPADDTEGHIAAAGIADFRKTFARAKRLTKQNKGSTLVTHLSAKRFYDLHKPKSVEGNIFNYNRKKLSYISKIKVPLLAVFGSKDKYVLNNYHQARLDLIKSSAKAPCTTVLIRNADHGFSRHTKELSKTLLKWLKKQ